MAGFNFIMTQIALMQQIASGAPLDRPPREPEPAPEPPAAPPPATKEEAKK